MDTMSNSLQKDFLQPQTKKKEFCLWEKNLNQQQNQNKQKVELLNCYHQFLSGLAEKIHSQTAQEHVHVLKLYASFLSGCGESSVCAEAFAKLGSKIRNLGYT